MLADGDPVQSLSLEPRNSEPFVVVEVTGELDLHTQDEFERVVSQLLGSSSVVVDLSGLEFLAISALRSLMVCHGLASSVGHELFYAGASQQTQRLLVLSGLDQVLPVATSVDQAVSASASVDRLPDQPQRNLAKLDVG